MVVDPGDERQSKPKVRVTSPLPPKAKNSVRREDPEQPRDALEDGEPASTKLVARTPTTKAPKTTLRPGDPERGVTSAEDDEPAVAKKTAHTPGVPTRKRIIQSGDPERAQSSLEDDGPALAAKAAHVPGVPVPKGALQSADPELRQTSPQDGETAPTEIVALAPAVSERGKAVQPSDPEQARARPADEENGSGIAPEHQVPAPSAAAPAVLADAPRFYSGEGLDSDAAEVVGARTTALGPADNKEAAPQPDNSAEIAQLDSKPDEGGAKAQDGQKTPGAVDPGKRVAELMEEIKRNNEILRRLSAEASDTTVHGPRGEDSGLRVRDPRAARTIEALLKDAPLGSVSGTVTDAAGRQLVPARVRVTDITETCLQAPLAEGFWCPGRFSVPVVGGPVRVEISRGRFHSTFVQGLQVKPGTAASLPPAAIGQPAALNFAARGWYLADLDMGLERAPGERPVWLGKTPDLDTLVLAAQAEGVRILGVPLPWGESDATSEIAALAAASKDVLLLPVFPGPRHAFYGCGMGLGMKSWEGLPREIAAPETPLREAFEGIRARDGLAVYKDLGGGKLVDIRRDVFSLFPRLEKTGFYPQGSRRARLYAANELPYDTVAGPAYDVIALDGTAVAEQLWFNLLSQDYAVSAIGAGGGSLEGGRLPYGQTFVAVDGELTRDKVIAAIREGRTAVSFGPAVFCRILERDKGPGSELSADGRRLTLQIQAYSSMSQDLQLDKIEVLRNGEVVHSQAASEGETQISNMCWTISEAASAWYVVRATERSNAPATGHKPGTAWTNAIRFRGPGYAPRAPAMSRITGTLRRGLTPVAGTVTAVVTGQPPRQVNADKNGNFKIELPVSGSLVFEAPGCEPLAQRVFEHPRVLRALGALQAEGDGLLRQQFEKASLFSAWRLLLADLEWDVTLLPSAATFFEAPQGELP